MASESATSSIGAAAAQSRDAAAAKMSEHTRVSSSHDGGGSAPDGPIIKGITGFNPPPRTKSKKDMFNRAGGYQRERSGKWGAANGGKAAATSYYSSVGTVIAGAEAEPQYDMDGYDSNLPPVCKFFRKGTCKAGMACRFRHTQEAAAEAARLRASMPPGAEYDDGYNRYDQPNDGFVTSDNGSVCTPAPKIPPNKRQYCPHKASAIMRAKTAQDSEERSWEKITGPFFGIDVECVATGTGHTHFHRTPARVAVVDGAGEQLLDEVIKVDEEAESKIVSYLTPLTGLNKEKCCDPLNQTFEEILASIKQTIPKDAVIVGHSVLNDIEWLGLEKGVDFRDYVDIGEIFRQRVPRFLTLAANVIKAELEDMGGAEADDPAGSPDNLVSTVGESEEGDPFADPDASKRAKADDSSVGFTTRYRIFSLRHCCINLMDVDMQQSEHDPIVDAKYAMLLFNKYHEFSAPKLRTVRDILHRAPVTPSFASKNPVIDSVCLSRAGYRHKRAARFIWKWWKAHHSGAN